MLVTCVAPCSPAALFFMHSHSSLESLGHLHSGSSLISGWTWVSDGHGVHESQVPQVLCGSCSTTSGAWCGAAISGAWNSFLQGQTSMWRQPHEAGWVSGQTMLLAGGTPATSDLFRFLQEVNPLPDSRRR